MLLIILTMAYSEKVLVVDRSKIIDRVMGMITKGELMRATVTWKQAHFGAVISRLLQLHYTDSRGNGEVGKGFIPSPGSNPTASREFCLYDVQDHVHTAWRVTISPFETISIHGSTDIWEHSMWVHVLAEPAWGPSCLPLWFWPPHMESYTQASPECQFAWRTWVPIP